jgi:hypothetical protein
MLPLVFLVGGARGFGYSQTVDNCAETPHTFDRSCVEDCPQCTPIAVTERGQDLSDATECVCIEGSLMGDDDSSDDDASKSWTLTPYDDCAFISNLGEYVALHAGAGNDVVDVKLAYRYSIIDAGAGDDDVSVMSADSKKIDGGAGDDAIYALRVGGHTGNELHGGKGDDTITLVYSSVDVFGGAGDDAISVTASSYSQLFGGDGDDTIDIGSDEGRGYTKVDGGNGAAPAPREARTTAPRLCAFTFALRRRRRDHRERVLRKHVGRGRGRHAERGGCPDLENLRGPKPRLRLRWKPRTRSRRKRQD